MKMFSTTAWAKQGEFGIRPIDSIKESKIFLEGWPEMERSPFYYFASNKVGAADQGSIWPDEAKEAFIDFLASAGALAKNRVEA